MYARLCVGICRLPTPFIEFYYQSYIENDLTDFIFNSYRLAGFIKLGRNKNRHLKHMGSLLGCHLYSIIPQ